MPLTKLLDGEKAPKRAYVTSGRQQLLEQKQFSETLLLLLHTQKNKSERYNNRKEIFVKLTWSDLYLSWQSWKTNENFD